MRGLYGRVAQLEQGAGVGQLPVVFLEIAPGETRQEATRRQFDTDDLPAHSFAFIFDLSGTEADTA